MEVRWRVSGFREIAFIVVGASGGAGPLCFVDAGGVVDDRIRDHADARGLALPDHVLKFSFGAFFGVKFVAYRLIARPPLRALDAFLRRRDLYVADAFGPQHFAAFAGDGFPIGLEHGHDHVAAVSRGIETFPAAFTCRHVKRGD